MDADEGLDRFGVTAVPQGYDQEYVRWVLGMGPRFATALREHRTMKMRMSQEAFVSGFNDVFGQSWHATVLAKIETHNRAVKLDEAFALAAYMRVPLERLIGRAPDGKHPEA